MLVFDVFMYILGRHRTCIQFKALSFRKYLLSAYYVHSAREKLRPKKWIQFLQEAIYIDRRKEVKWSGNGTEERPEIDVKVGL